MSSFFDFLKVLMICLSVLVALTLVLIFTISQMPNNPLRHAFEAVARRMGATVGGLMLIPPESTLPIIGEIGDLVTVAFIIYYWSTLMRDIQKSTATTQVVTVDNHDRDMKRVN